MAFWGPRWRRRPGGNKGRKPSRRFKKIIRPLIIVVFIAIAAYSVFDSRPGSVPSGDWPQTGERAADDLALGSAYQQRKSNLQVDGEGVVVHVLPDDDRGSRHQKFLLQLASGQTLLIAHNIDIAPRIPHLQEGDVVTFRGEYEWNERGGVVHWTHRADDGDHRSGWLKHRGITYD